MQTNAEEITPSESVIPVYLVPLTAEEVQSRVNDEKIYNDTLTSLSTIRASALAKLEALGLTPDEVDAIVGG
jgi:hypothetical protein